MVLVPNFMRYLLFFTSVFCLLAACGSTGQEPVPEGQSRLIFTEFVLQAHTQELGAAQTDLGVHAFSEEVVFTLQAEETGEETVLLLDLNRIAQNPSLILPRGEYRFTLRSPEEALSPFLPVQGEGKIQLNTPELRFIPELESRHGLFTVAAQNVASPPRWLGAGEAVSFGRKADYFLLYAKEGQRGRMEVEETIRGGVLRRDLQAAAFRHAHFEILAPEAPGAAVQLAPAAFITETEEIRLPGSLPGSYSPEIVRDLEEEVRESSGLAFFGGSFWTVNDSGNENIVYQLDPETSLVQRRVRVENAPNIDWESLAQDEQYLYIGDFGNNNGVRQDLVIQRVAQSDLLASTSVQATPIRFRYPDQTDFSFRPNAHDFDCEAFFYRDGMLHLFTKNWLTETTRYYRIPAEPGEHVAELVGEFEVNGLITGADVNVRTGDAVLIGYRLQGLSSQVFVVLLRGYREHVFDGEQHRMVLGSPATLGQTEAIQLLVDNRGKISSESFRAGIFQIPGRWIRFDFSDFL
ncbi:hypothetical protein A3SI_02296 [Nitritalea halalkaliphila LW7]|uniref:Lipoprotein n=1 Tax=Nitritalea halalkaliphila LW7 TaxID=1189621 RepID=I5C9Q3_9BACT|nr:hypothetical protein [Nitritalea halalkaliphila]EIM78555.1 hypothetical protein A3SI_02296 [Nitritalea halalkaliphila LW7]